jgi:outer membrane protein TolC
MKNTKLLNGLILFLLSTSVGGICDDVVPDTLQNAETPCSPEQLQEKSANVTLQETLEKIYMQNTELDAARAGLRAEDEDVSQANADWRPSLSVEGIQAQRQNYPIGRGTRSHESDTSYNAVVA